MKQAPKRVAILIAPADFRDEEYFQPKVMLDAVGITVSTVAKGNPAEVTGVKGGKAHTDTLLEGVTPDTFDGLILVGGKGAYSYFDDPDVHSIVKSFCDNQKTVGAICIAPVILARAGVLKGRNATVFEDGITELKTNGANYVKTPLVVDNNLITACDFTVAMKFGSEIAKRVKAN